MIIKICWALLSLLHVMPALALFRPALLEKMYGVRPGSELFTLLHHRAALFLVIVVISVWAMFRPEVRALASITVGISMMSFILVWWLSGASPALRTIAVADMIGLPILLFVAWQAFRSIG
jgi:hypothetical protein